ncbi:KilA-N domain-containing protein [Acetobacter sacchari]|uniref:KilA-N domain-containing protein n=1 Tax=Acetobacter sacchari TaxID=2661687 RepID=A0ABS3LXJ5_9PROT|nr:KilA-N domain-containing protein [Acetobacter sacchari]MBO1360618.1 KilA-N domain-containing protein [Acetobacter sacchari]
MSHLTTLTYNNAPIHIRDEMLCLTDMWSAAGKPDNKRPADWMLIDGTKGFLEYLAESLKVAPAHFDKNQGVSSYGGLVVAKRGGSSPGTWAHWQIGFAYAKYLSPEFHAWCNTAAREKMEGRQLQSSVSVAELEAAVRTVVGGIVKGVVNKALREHLEPVMAHLANLDTMAKYDPQIKPAPVVKSRLEQASDLVRELLREKGRVHRSAATRAIQELVPAKEERGRVFNNLVSSGEIVTDVSIAGGTGTSRVYFTAGKNLSRAEQETARATAPFAKTPEPAL